MKRNQKTVAATVTTNKKSLKSKIIMVGLSLLVLTASYLTVLKVNKKVEKDTINIYVCEIVDVDVNSHMMGMRCMVKDQKE